MIETIGEVSGWVFPHYRTKVPPQPLLWSRPHLGTTVSQKKRLTWGEFRCIYTFRVPAYLELSVLCDVWKSVLGGLYAGGNFEDGKWP
jgi:hypothetical protein